MKVDVMGMSILRGWGRVGHIARRQAPGTDSGSGRNAVLQLGIRRSGQQDPLCRQLKDLWRIRLKVAGIRRIEKTR